MNIELAVKKLTSRFGTSSPFELADFLNVKVFIRPLGKNTKGFYQYYKKCKMIFINSNLNDTEKKVVCGHELGHALLHPKINIIFLDNHTLFKKDKYECEANKFCTYLLLTDEVISEYSSCSAEQISAVTGIPVNYINLIVK